VVGAGFESVFAVLAAGHQVLQDIDQVLAITQGLVRGGYVGGRYTA
jgi:hypothetical protein